MTWFGLALPRPFTSGDDRCSIGAGHVRLEVSLDVEFGGTCRTARRRRPCCRAVSRKSARGKRRGRPKRLAANARKSIEAALADFRWSADGVTVDAAVTSLRLVGIEFDVKTLRAIAEADGTVRVAVAKLP